VITTKQEVFTRVATHLLRQMQRSIGRDGSCQYRARDGLRCAIGCLIDDDCYSPDLEGQSVDVPDVLAALDASGVKRGSITLLSELQGVHDDFEPAEWRDRLEAVARKHHLTMPELP
jgi:hypothetical protein